MPLTSSQYQSLIVADLTADATELIQAPTLTAVQGYWPAYDDKDAQDPDLLISGPHLHYLYTKRHAVERMLGDAWQDTAISLGGAQLNESSPFDKLQKLHDILTKEIEMVEDRAKGSRSGTLGQLTTTAPLEPSGIQVDRNDSVYVGDPLKPISPVSGGRVIW